MDLSSVLITANKKSQQKLDNIDKSLQTLIATQKKETQQNALRDRRAAQAANRADADRKETKRNKDIFAKDKQEKKKGIDIKKLLAALGIGAIGAYFASEDFRKFVNDKVFGPIKEAMYDAVLGDDGLFGKKNREKIGDAIKNEIKYFFSEENLGNIREQLFGKKGIFGEDNRKAVSEALFGKDGILGEKNVSQAYEGFKSFFVDDADWKKAARKGIKSFFVDDAEWKKTFRSGMDIIVTDFGNFIGRIRDSLGNWIKSLPGIGAFIQGADDVAEGIQKETQRLKSVVGIAPPSEQQTAARTRLGELQIEDTMQLPLGNESEKIARNIRMEDQRKLIKLLEERDNAQLEMDRGNAMNTGDPKYREFNRTKKDQLEKKIENLNKKINLWQKMNASGDAVMQGMQTGGVFKVPGTGSGDKVPAMLPNNSFVLNRNASNALFRQKGGPVNVMLEPQETVFTPGMWDNSISDLNSSIPRFQTGGEISTSEASDGRKSSSKKPSKKDESKLNESSIESSGKTGADAIIAAAEASAGIYLGVGNMCARTVREVLERAGHPAAMKTTSSADLDSPVGYGPSKVNTDLAGSFAGNDMGTLYNNPTAAPPGSVIMWRGTTEVEKYGPNAVTHVGLKGKGNDMYHHGRSKGWRKDNLQGYMPDFAIDLNGKAKGGNNGGSGNGIADALLGAGALAGGAMGLLGPYSQLFALFGGASLLQQVGEVASGLASAFGLDGLFGGDTASSSSSGSTGYSPSSGGGVPDDPEFKAEVTRLAKKYDIPEKNLYGVMSFESGGTFDPGKKNMAGSGATGLIQFMPSTAAGLGTSTAALADMTRGQQMKFVEKYFDQAGLPKGASFEDLYMSILYPKAVGKPNDYKLFGKGGDMPGAYSQNAGLDANGDGSITKFEAAAKAREHVGKFQTGGMVGNPTLLEPGETVATMDAWNQAIPRFQRGGSANMSGMYTQQYRDFMDGTNQMNSNQSPPVIVMPMPGGNGGRGGGGVGQHPENPTPNLPSGPSMPALSDVINRVSWSSVF